jgi:hypothetical protein
MKIRGGFGIGAALLLLVALGGGLRAWAQIGVDPPNISGADAYWNSNKGGLQDVRLPPQGIWAEIINVTPRWMVVQNNLGQQFPISTDRIRQFLVRWPSSPAMLSPNSMVEVTGPEAGSNVVIADHIDQYEADAQSLVSPAVNNLYGLNRTLSAFDVDQMNTFGTVYWMTPEEYAMPSRMHIVGNAVSNDPVRVSGFGNNYYTIQPSANGMTVSQVTMGTSSFARRGDIVYLTPENVGPRSLVVSQLVLYKKIPLRQFQP